jgi:hypothetical protein
MNSRSPLLSFLPLLICCLFPFTLSCEQTVSAEPPPEGTPRLVVLVVADQFRYDYLERARPFFTGGLARLLDGGVSFTRAHHGHGRTSTAPGHAALSTGTHPARSGMVANGFYDRKRPDEWTDSVGDDRFGTSPKNLLVPALGDWIKDRYPRSKVVAASGKDRGAVLLGGHEADGAFWYDRAEGRFVTSGYYLSAEPEWLAAFDEAGPPDAFLDAWRPVAEIDPAAAAAAGFAAMDRGPFDRGFPRLIGDSVHRDGGFHQGLYDSPFLDQWLGRLVPELVAEYELGADEWPDLLALSFSSLDNVGHDHGPDSLEVLDTLVRLDRILGELFATSTNGSASAPTWSPSRATTAWLRSPNGSGIRRAAPASPRSSACVAPPPTSRTGTAATPGWARRGTSNIRGSAATRRRGRRAPPPPRPTSSSVSPRARACAGCGPPPGSPAPAPTRAPPSPAATSGTRPSTATTTTRSAARTSSSSGSPSCCPPSAPTPTTAPPTPTTPTSRCC